VPLRALRTKPSVSSQESAKADIAYFLGVTSVAGRRNGGFHVLICKPLVLCAKNGAGDEGFFVLSWLDLENGYK